MAKVVKHKDEYDRGFIDGKNGDKRRPLLHISTLNAFLNGLLGLRKFEVLREAYEAGYLNGLAEQKLMSKEMEESAKIFSDLFEWWNRDTAMISNISVVITHPAYYRIIAMGKRALPFIFKGLAAETGPWYVALDAIVSTNFPDPPRISSEQSKSASTLKTIWIEWAKAHGFIETEGAASERPN